MAARECETEMTLEILDEVAFLFVEQFDNLYGMLVDRTDVKRIRKSADDGEDGLFKVVASVFGDKLPYLRLPMLFRAFMTISHQCSHLRA